jgi:hypothetical protein
MADEIDVVRHFRDETPGPSPDAWLRARDAIAAAQAQESATARPLRERHHLRLRLALVTATGATIAAAAVVAAVLVNTSAPAGESVETAAYVTRVERALVAGQQDFVEYSRTVYSPAAYAEPVPGGLLTLRNATVGPSIGPRWAVGAAVRWSYRGTVVYTAQSATGQRLFSWTITGGSTVAVIYANSTWWRATGRATGTGTPARSTCGPYASNGSRGWVAFIRSQLRCGAYTVAGRQFVDGVDAIKIDAEPGADALSTLWVDPQTYLPVRVISANLQTDFRWLTPEPSALGELKLNVPPGFREVPPPSL